MNTHHRRTDADAADHGLGRAFELAVDKASPAYRQLRGQLTRVIKANPKLHYAYVMGMKNGNVIFLVENEKMVLYINQLLLYF